MDSEPAFLPPAPLRNLIFSSPSPPDPYLRGGEAKANTDKYRPRGENGGPKRKLFEGPSEVSSLTSARERGKAELWANKLASGETARAACVRTYTSRSRRRVFLPSNTIINMKAGKSLHYSSSEKLEKMNLGRENKFFFSSDPNFEREMERKFFFFPFFRIQPIVFGVFRNFRIHFLFPLFSFVEKSFCGKNPSRPLKISFDLVRFSTPPPSFSVYSRFHLKPPKISHRKNKANIYVGGLERHLLISRKKRKSGGITIWQKTAEAATRKSK